MVRFRLCLFPGLLRTVEGTRTFAALCDGASGPVRITSYHAHLLNRECRISGDARFGDNVLLLVLATSGLFDGKLGREAAEVAGTHDRILT